MPFNGRFRQSVPDSTGSSTHAADDSARLNGPPPLPTSNGKHTSPTSYPFDSFSIQRASALTMQPNRKPPLGGQHGSGHRDHSRNHRGERRPRPRHPDKEVDQRIRELDAERDPLSLPEEIVSEANKVGKRVGIPAADQHGQPLNIAELQQLTTEALLPMAAELAIESADSL